MPHLPSLIPADAFVAGQLVPALARLNRGDTLRFSHQEGGQLAFTVERSAGRLVMRCPAGQDLASAPTFAELWRQRPGR